MTDDVSKEKGSQPQLYFWKKVARLHLARSEVITCLHQIKANTVCPVPIESCWPWWGYLSATTYSLGKAGWWFRYIWRR